MIYPQGYQVEVLQGPPPAGTKLGVPGVTSGENPGAAAWNSQNPQETAAKFVGLLGALHDWTNAVSDLWSGGKAAAGAGVDTAKGAYATYQWWDKHKGQVKIGAALTGGTILGLVVWRVIK